MNASLIPRTILSLVEPSVQGLAGRLFVLTSGRAGSKKYQPTVTSFFETGLVTSLYEHLMMSPILAHLEIRHEMPYPGVAGRPKRVDLWLRPVNGGYPHLIEAGDFAAGKVHSDLAKVKAIHEKGAHWFLAFFRKPCEATDPWAVVEASFKRKNGLDSKKVETKKALSKTFTVYRPNGQSDPFGVALFRGK